MIKKLANSKSRCIFVSEINNNLKPSKMKNYTFSFDENGNQLTTGTFKGETKKQAKVFAQLYKRRELKNDFPNAKLNRVSIN